MSSDASDLPTLVWTNPSASEDKPSLVCLRPGVVTLAVIPAEELKRAAASIADGGDVRGRAIPLPRITRVRGQDKSNTLQIGYKQAKGKIESISVRMANAAQRDELLTALTERLGPDWECERRQVNRFSAALWPIGSLVVGALLTWACYFEAEQIVAGNDVLANDRPVRLKVALGHWLLELLGPVGVLLVGALFATFCVLWLASDLRTPPNRITLRPR